MLGVAVGDGLDGGLGELVDLGAGVRHENGGVGGNDELRALLHQVSNQHHQPHQSRGGECRLGLVENIKPVSAESVFHQSEKALAV